MQRRRRMRGNTLIFTTLFIAAVAATSSRAAIDVDVSIPKSSGLQLVVMEAPGCAYCGNFRRDILPVFEASERSKELPVRFLDVNDLDSAKLELDAPVELVPTFVLTQHGKEIGRIPGYVGMDVFFRSISHLLSAIE
jgi:thioredoxin-related protein